MKLNLIPTLIITVTSVALYANTLLNGFVYDDYATIVNNGFIADLHNLSKLFTNEYFIHSKELSYRPVVTFTYFADHFIFDLKPWGFHLTNVLIHTANGLILYVFLTMLMNKLAIEDSGLRTSTVRDKLLLNLPFLISLLFISHPAMTEAVNAISFREDLLVFFFYISALTLYLAIRAEVDFKPLSMGIIYLISCLLYMMALFSKEMAATLPLITCCYEWLYGNGRKRLRSIFNKYNLGLIFITMAYIYLRFYLLYSPIEGEIEAWIFFERILSLPSLIIYYLKLIIFPLSLTTQHTFAPIKSLFTIALIVPLSFIVLIVFMAFSQRTNKVVSFGLSFFLITMIPVYNIVPIANPFAERYLYLPSIGVLMIGGSLYTLIRGDKYGSIKAGKPYISVIFFIIISIYFINTIKRNTVWRDDYSLWANTVNNKIESDRAYNNLGIAYGKQGRYDEAMKVFLTVLRHNSTNVEAHNNVGLIYFKTGMLDEAIKEFNIALSLDPSYSEGHYNLGIVYLDKGLKEKAVKEFQNVLKTSPDFLPARQALQAIK